MTTRQDLIALNAADNLNRGALCRLARTLEDWMNTPSRLAAEVAFRLGVPNKALKRALTALRERQRWVDLELERAERCDCRITTLADDTYPPSLLDHPLPPPVLYHRGDIPQGPAVAMVGSRKMTPYGDQVTRLFARHLAAAGVVVVSGFARGVDAVAHRAALQANGGRTLAVLGCGLDVDYPRGQRDLAADIARHGAVVSEFPLGSPPLKWHFPIRNRVIAALSSGTLVVEAAQRSGSLITAHLAMELGRDVYAVPGSIFEPLCVGPNRLIADGAVPVLSPDDIYDCLPLAQQLVLFPPSASSDTASQRPDVRPAAAPSPTVTPPPAPSAVPPPKGFTGKLLQQLDDTPRVAEDLAAAADASIDRVLAALLELELGGWVSRLPGPTYARA